ncbi:HIT family protein [Paenibacillus chondroitinus]|uniref:HIT family protein n=1 Tax=Paenibacillus chondroitinus TaxID=59842 RepID=A0ABU6DK51_9BACL|nr:MULTISPECIES: HIT family protein [Paenibacillus]MCY9660657.1 HIT family protein [Paenibacillus anseongense]MEB4798163.1 HIT family protein [Paenibacillus chondroitinus]
MNHELECLGCRLAHGLEPTHVVYEDEHVTCILVIDPCSEGHSIILPKKHYADVDDLDLETAQSVMKASANLSKGLKTLFHPDGISMMQNGGKFSDLGHFHMHIWARYENDGFSWIDPLDAGARERFTETREILASAIANLGK